MTDATMESDYHFLEDIVGTVESGKRFLQHVGGASSTSSNPPQHKRARPTDDAEDKQHLLMRITNASNTNESATGPKPSYFVQQAAQRGVTVVYMPAGMERHKTNSSCIKKKELYWTVEWCVHFESNYTKRTLVKDDCTLQQCLLQVLNTERLAVKDYHILIKRLPCSSNKPRYVELNATSTLAMALQDITVYEYPTIEIVPESAISRFPRAITQVNNEDDAFQASQT
jgi:hypothetical protein